MHGGETRMRNARGVSRVLIAALAVSALGLVTGPSAALAGTPVLPAYPSVVGYDDEGNPVYSTAGKDILDPDEDPSGMADQVPYVDADEVVVGDQASGETCTPKTTVTLKNLANKLNVDWADSVINKSTSKGKYTVKAETSKKFTWSLSASAAGEFKAAIFAKVTVTINGGISSEKTTTYGSTFEVEVPAKTTIKADRGMWQEKFSYTYYSVGKTCLIKRGSGTGQAPYRQAWHIYN